MHCGAGRDCGDCGVAEESHTGASAAAAAAVTTGVALDGAPAEDSFVGVGGLSPTHESSPGRPPHSNQGSPQFNPISPEFKCGLPESNPDGLEFNMGPPQYNQGTHQLRSLAFGIMRRISKRREWFFRIRSIISACIRCECIYGLGCCGIILADLDWLAIVPQTFIRRWLE